MEFFMQLFPGIGTFFAVEPVIAVARIVLMYSALFWPAWGSSGLWSR